jgi:group I intron endonuclease
MARKEKTIHYLYKTTCNVNGRYYVGMHSTNNLEDGYMGSGRRLRASMRKYGIENFSTEILEFFETRELLIEAEIKAITPEMITDKNCMNLMGGGTGGFISDEQQRHRSICANKAKCEKLKNDNEFRLIHSEKAYKNLKKYIDSGNHNHNTFEGKTHTDESKQLMSEKKKGLGVGETNSQFGTCWITKDDINKKIKKEDLEVYLNDGWLKGRK